MLDTIKKKRDKPITRRFNSEDLKNWQKEANESAGGNLTLWIEITLNNHIKQNQKKPKK